MVVIAARAARAIIDLRNMDLLLEFKTSVHVFSRQQERRKYRFHVYFIRFRHCIGMKINRRLELILAIGASPKVTDLPFAHAFRPFGGNNTISALGAGHVPEGTISRTTGILERRRGHGYLPWCFLFFCLFLFQQIQKPRYAIICIEPCKIEKLFSVSFVSRS